MKDLLSQLTSWTTFFDKLSAPHPDFFLILPACHYTVIFAYFELQGVSFQKLVLPHNDICKSLYTFLKDGYIPEALLNNTNPNNLPGGGGRGGWWGAITISRNIVLPLLQS